MTTYRQPTMEWKTDAGDEPGTTEKVEQTETGYRVTISSKRGTGTRDQDTVKIEARTEDYPSPGLMDAMHDDVSLLMEARREHQPDEEDGA